MATPKVGLFFTLFSNCLLVKGAVRSSICDLQRGRVKLIPNSLHDILLQLKEKTVKEVKDYYEGMQNEGIDKYLDLLVEQDYGFFTDEPLLFPELNLKWVTPSEITNAIIDFDRESDHPLSKIVSELSVLGCRSLMLRFFCPIDLSRLESILNEITGSRINSVEIVMEFNNELASELKRVHRKFLFIRSLTLFGSPFNEQHFYKEMDLHLQLISDKIVSEQNCGIVDETLFTVNLEHFSESISFNSCLNCKVGIDRFGSVKNCPSLSEGHGDIKNLSLKDIVNAREFRKLWTVRKDQISDCKDCEFRHVCTDCRAYLKNPTDLLSKPLKCNYDPYTATWSNQVTTEEPLSGSISVK